MKKSPITCKPYKIITDRNGSKGQQLHITQYNRRTCYAEMIFPKAKGYTLQEINYHNQKPRHQNHNAT